MTLPLPLHGHPWLPRGTIDTFLAVSPSGEIPLRGLRERPFVINQRVQYRAALRRDYRFGEAVHVGLSLVARSALAWQVFANTLVPS